MLYTAWKVDGATPISRGLSWPLTNPTKGVLSEAFPLNILGCPRKLGSMVRINGLFHLLIHGILIGVSYNPLI